ncbi:MAG: hypothetical protein H0T57_05645 [Rubrobacter sp.]|nr:hypothetical protein [Rubrobacter sp.]
MDLEPQIRHMYGPEEATHGLDELTVVCLVCDGRPYLKFFVEQYASIGVKHMVFCGQRLCRRHHRGPQGLR